VDESPATAVVSRVIAALSGDTALAEAGGFLERDVLIHVDDGESHRGLGLWKRWVHLMRERGRLGDLRFEPVTTVVDGDLVTVTFHWSGRSRRGRSGRRPPTTNLVRYRVAGDRVAEIWTRKANYVDVFGRWIAVRACYRLFLCWGWLYFVMRRDPAFRLGP
jgi:SnoaL-like domain